MTGHQVNSLVSDLVLMAKAMEELPGIKAELDHAQGIADHRAETIQRLELKLMDAKNLEDSLRASIRDLEVARDDAELRFLEAEDQTAKVRSLVASLALVIQPPTAPHMEPVERGEEAIHSSGQSELDPTAHGSDGNTNESTTAPSPTAPTAEPVATKPWWEQDVKHD